MQHFYFLAVFEWTETIRNNGFPAQFVTAKKTKTGEVGIEPGERTADVVLRIASGIRESDPDLPSSAQLVAITILPDVLVGNVE